MEKKFQTAFAETIREQVVHKNEVEVPGLGIFKKDHIRQFQEQYADGQVVMMPPKDVIRFIPDKKTGV